MKFELKSIQTNLSFSEETICFRAILYVDGVKAAHCENDGHGGSTFINYLDKTIEAKVSAYVATLPPVVTDIPDHTDPTKKFTYPQSDEHIVDDLVQQHLKKKSDDKVEKSLKKFAQKCAVKGHGAIAVILGDGNAIMQGFSAVQNPQLIGAEIIAKEKLEGAEIRILCQPNAKVSEDSLNTWANEIKVKNANLGCYTVLVHTNKGRVALALKPNEDAELLVTAWLKGKRRKLISWEVL